MPKVRKKKAPITGPPPSTASSKPESSRYVIRKFHVLLKQQAQLQKKLDYGDPTASKALADIQHEIDELGGLDNYQRMSTIGQGNDRGCGSEKVLIRWLKEGGMHKLGERLKLLEVGALKPDNYDTCSSWIETTPIDLNSRHPAIMEQDFLLMDGNKHKGNWDIISLSLVVNFAPNAADRGRMLCLAHKLLRSDGRLFVALPLPCLLNSRYLDFELFSDLMSFIGFKELHVKWKQGGKMVYWLYKKQEVSRDSQAIPERFTKKRVIRQGDRNNFAIIL